jgi:TonB family protein
MNMNTIVLTRPKPLSYSLGMSMGFHVLLVLILGRNLLFQSSPPLPNESQTEFRIIPKKPPPPVVQKPIEKLRVEKLIPTPAIKQKFHETQIEKMIPVKPVVVQIMSLPVPIKATLSATATIASLPMTIASQSVAPIKSMAQTSSRTQVIESPVAVSMSLGLATPRAKHSVAVPSRRAGRKSLVHSGAPVSFANKLYISALQPRDSTASTARQAAGIQSLDSVNAYTFKFLESSTTSPNQTGGEMRSSLLQSGATAYLNADSLPRSYTQLTDAKILNGYLRVIQKAIASSKRYPEEERQALHTGHMKVAFTLLRGGQIERLRLKEKSQHQRLNQAALDAVSEAVPFSKFPPEVIEDSINVVIPFRFDLN